jgi:hypothetical protein
MADAKSAADKTYTTDFIKSDTDRAVFLGNAVMDDMMTALIALGAETWAVRRRAKITEMLFEKNGKISRDMVEQYMPTADEERLLRAERDEFIRDIYGHFARGGEDVIALNAGAAPAKK